MYVISLDPRYRADRVRARNKVNPRARRPKVYISPGRLIPLLPHRPVSISEDMLEVNKHLLAAYEGAVTITKVDPKKPAVSGVSKLGDDEEVPALKVTEAAVPAPVVETPPVVEPAPVEEPVVEAAPEPVVEEAPKKTTRRRRPKKKVEIDD